MLRTRLLACTAGCAMVLTTCQVSAQEENVSVYLQEQEMLQRQAWNYTYPTESYSTYLVPNGHDGSTVSMQNFPGFGALAYKIDDFDANAHPELLEVVGQYYNSTGYFGIGLQMYEISDGSVVLKEE